MLAGEDRIEEEALEPLIGQVDHQLLKAVTLKDFKAEHVEKTDASRLAAELLRERWGRAAGCACRRAALAAAEHLVDAPHRGPKEAFVEALDQRVTRKRRGVDAQRYVIH